MSSAITMPLLISSRDHAAGFLPVQIIFVTFVHFFRVCISFGINILGFVM